ncbi:hypothetical protein GCM10023231_01820 [Olivibacter ginsenosidimutans]|uniref:DUF4974 domain-containing protein n=1 Tax=Olivibacter ginsenosidimutans TaxID=1176537 RepID=A0ABP9ADR3_9SPHI
MKLFQLQNPLFAFALSLSLTLYSFTYTLAQDQPTQRIVLKANTASVEELIAALAKQAGLNVVYSDISSELPKSEYRIQGNECAAIVTTNVRPN